MNDGLTVYEIGDGDYIYRDSLNTLINRELEKVHNSKDREEFKRGYRQALETVKNWTYSGSRVADRG